MKNLMKRGLALLLALVICVSLLPVVSFEASAAGTYVYNWGERGETATSLSQNAEDFYEKYNTSYGELSSNSGGTGKSDAPTSALYDALKDLMVSAHKNQTGYNETKSLFKYTDCQNGGGKISSFYSGKAIGPSWDGGWNREHTWPDSKGLGGSDEDDIMMLRPTSTSENSSRGNTAYGKSSGYYNPNSESGGEYDLRGDVARIFLYVYVRWGNTGGTAWGTSGVMESVTVLLEWMEADPVDTWELGRNDSVESITGTRNVFVDYPELAFLLFGEEIPADMTTPSGAVNKTCNHDNFDTGTVVPATCTEEGYVLFTCQTAGCGYSYKDSKTQASGHTYLNGACTVCGEAEKPTYNALTEIKDGDVVVIGAPAYNMALSAEKVSADSYYNKGVSYEGGFADVTDAELFVVKVNSDGSYTFTSKTGVVIALGSQYSSLNADGEHKSWTLEAKSGSSGVFYLKNTGRNAYLEWYASKGNWSAYNPDTLSDLFELSFYTVDQGGNGGGGLGDGSDTPDEPCSHSYTTVVIAPTCTAGGFTIYVCPLCNDKHTDNATKAVGHSYSGDECTVCGEQKVTTPSSVTISFTDKANRTELTASKQVWQQNGITVTNNKAGSTVDVADYANPVRFYQGSEVIIDCTGIVKLVIDCTGLDSKYVSSWTANAPAGATATNNGGIITVEFATPVDSVTYTGLAKQSRACSITVHTVGGGDEAPSCEHKSFDFEGAASAACTVSGHTGRVRCLDCGNIIHDGQVIPATDHSWVEANGAETCERCGITKPGDTTDTPDQGDTPDDDTEGSGAAEKDHGKCEAGGFKAFLNAIANFFRSLFGGRKKCVCGEFYD